MENYAHLDEKWFHLTKTSNNYCLSLNETAPTRTIRNKRYIEMVMFLVEVARPRHDGDVDVIFDGKLDLWPFVEHVSAQRSSTNRAKGTLIKKSKNVDKEEYKNLLINEVTPATFLKWLEKTPWKIKMEHEYGPAHVQRNDVDVVAAGYRRRTTIVLDAQLPNSPDFNVLDLGMFARMRSMQYKSAPRNVE